MTTSSVASLNTPLLNDVVEDTADTHTVSKADISEAVAAVYDDLVDGANAIHKHYVDETDDESLSPIITEQGRVEVIFIEPEMWDQMAVRFDFPSDVEGATKAAHETYALAVGADENAVVERAALVMPSYLLAGLTHAGLSRRQAEVQILRMNDHTHEAISDTLDMEIGTVKSHCHRIDQKINAAESLLDLIGKENLIGERNEV
jgi:DNA-binding CsgD family transcriptional regulator